MSMRLAVPREPMFTGAILKLITISGFRDSKVRLSILLGIRELILMIILKDFERGTTYIYIYTRPRRHEGSYRWYGGGGGVHQPLKSGRHGSLLNTEFNFISASDSQGIEDDVIYLCINIVLPGSN